MDYKKAYEDAIDKAKTILKTPYTAHWDTMKEVVEHLFPELAESEDKRIRKEIIQFLRDYHFDRLSNKVNIDTLELWAAWLEKQGEQLDANKEYWRGYREGKQEILDKYATLEKQGEQNPVLPGLEEQERVAGRDYIHVEWVEAIENYGKWKIVRTDEQNPAWSEEDEKMLNGIIDAAVHHCHLNQTDVEFLKALKERYTLLGKELMTLLNDPNKLKE